mgnify:CR=1 FL=1|jgi:Response regulator containing a CheY-like receiver domain and an HTH DNA-binding domain
MIVERRISPDAMPDAAIAPQAATALIGAIGTPGFIAAAMAFGERMIGAGFISVFCQGDRDKPLLVGTATRLDHRRAERAARGYEGHAQEDRNSDYLLGKEGDGDFMTVQEAASLASFTYRRDCYEGPGISSRISLIRRRHSYGLAVNLYSASEDGPFSADVYDRALATLGMLLAATERHVAFSLQGDVWQGQDIQTRLALTYPDLTRREREVAAMSIKGRTASEISEILGLSETTVITHRKNAYKRMNVRSLRHLMART